MQKINFNVDFSPDYMILYLCNNYSKKYQTRHIMPYTVCLPNEFLADAH